MSVYRQIGDEMIGAAEPSWGALVDAVPDLARLESTPQDPRHHHEGNVGIHTRMVLNSLRESTAWQAQTDPAKRRLAWACLLHDIAKAWKTKVEDDGTITSRGHSVAGELASRATLWAAEASVEDREAICRMVKWHQAPFFVGLREDALGLQMLSLSVKLSELAIVARADAMGRRTMPPEAAQETLDNIDLFEALARQLDVWDLPRLCVGATERGIWLEKSGGYDPSYPWPSPVVRPLLVATCGMPASGKSTFARALGLPETGLDWARSELGAGHGEDEGAARNLALAELKKHLARGSSVVFDATNLIADHRQRLAQQAAAYGADCIFVHHEAANPKELHVRNASRGDKAVPVRAMASMLEKWSAPVGDEGCGQLFVKNGEMQPVWGALDSISWARLLEKARALAQRPVGKPLGSKRSNS